MKLPNEADATILAHTKAFLASLPSDMQPDGSFMGAEGEIGFDWGRDFAVVVFVSRTGYVLWSAAGKGVSATGGYSLKPDPEEADSEPWLRKFIQEAKKNAPR